MISCLFAWLAAGTLEGETLLRAERRAVVRARAAALLLSGQQGGGIPLHVLALPGMGSSGETAIVVEAAGPPLLDGFDGTALEVEIFVYALDSRQEVVSGSSQHLSLDLRRHREVLEQGGLKAVTSLPLPPGSSLLRVLVRSAGGAIGLKSALVEVAPGKPGSSLLPPLLPAPADQWLIVVDPKEGDNDPAEAYPFRLGEETFVPSPRPKLEAVAEVPALLAGRWSLEPPSEVRLSLRSLGTGIESSQVVSQVERWPGSIGGLDLLSLTLDLSSQKAGVYALRIAVSGVDGLEVESPELEVWLSQPSRGPSPPQLAGQLDSGRGFSTSNSPALKAPARGSPVNRSSAGGTSATAAADLEELRRGYHRVLLHLGEGSREAAGEILEALLAQAAGLGEGASGALAESLNQEVATLPPASWDGLLALAVAHGEAADALYSGKKFVAGNLASTLSMDLVEARAKRLGSAVAHQDASRLLTRMATVFLNLGSSARCVEYLRRSLQFWPENADALLLLAAWWEKQGDASRAADLLGRLARLDPEHLEARLRWAINLGKLGQGRRARRLLQELFSAKGSGWVQLLAGQELARSEVDAGRAVAGEQTLLKALKRWPENPRLHLQLVSLLEAQGRPVDARVWLAGTSWRADPEGESERSRYNSWPREGLARGHEVLLERGERASQHLGRSLARRDALAAKRGGRGTVALGSETPRL